MGAAAKSALVVLLVGLAHVAIGMAPSPPFSWAMNLVIFGANLYVLYCASTILRGRRASYVALFFGGYLALAGLLLIALGNQPLFVLLIIVYASVFGSPPLLGFFAIFVLCFVLLQPYAFETFFPLTFIYVALWRARGSRSPFTLACLGIGLLALAAVLFPLLHLVVQDSVQTLWLTLTRDDVRDALTLSLVAATATTLFIALWGIPLAYAMARLDLPGKRALEVLVDLPILIPQSVAAIALIDLFGSGSPLGAWLESIGLGISGTVIALIIAQVFVASPFLIKTALAAFESVPLSLEQASRSLGCGPAKTFWRISLPLAARGIAIGAALAWARAISVLGTVILFASSPESAPVLVHTEFLRAGTEESRPIAVVLLIVCVWFFLLFRYGDALLPFARRRSAPGETGGYAVLTLANISHRLGEFALRDLSLTVPAGSYCVLLGPSGCGKSVLLQTIAGFHQPDLGTIQLGDVDLCALPPEERSIGLVFQRGALFPHLTVRENVEYGLRARKMTAADREKRVAELIEKLGLGQILARPVATLSGGEVQRVAIARALAPSPRLLLLDEPLSLLDHNARLALRDELTRVHRDGGLTTLHVTHSRAEARALADHVAVMIAGHVVQVAPQGELFAKPRCPFVAAFVGAEPEAAAAAAARAEEQCGEACPAHGACNQR